MLWRKKYPEFYHISVYQLTWRDKKAANCKVICLKIKTNNSGGVKYLVISKGKIRRKPTVNGWLQTPTKENIGPVLMKTEKPSHVLTLNIFCQKIN